MRVFPLQLRRKEQSMWTKFINQPIKSPTFKQFLKYVEDIKNKVINKKTKPFNNALGDINPLVLGNTLKKLEYIPNWQLHNNLFFKFNISKFLATLDEQITHTKIIKTQIESYQWGWLVDLLLQHLLLFMNRQNVCLFHRFIKTSNRCMKSHFITTQLFVMKPIINKNIEQH